MWSETGLNWNFVGFFLILLSVFIGGWLVIAWLLDKINSAPSVSATVIKKPVSGNLQRSSEHLFYISKSRSFRTYYWTGRGWSLDREQAKLYRDLETAYRDDLLVEILDSAMNNLQDDDASSAADEREAR